MISYLYPDKFNNRATAAANNNPRTCCFFVILSVFCVPRNLDINSLNAVVHYYHDNGEHNERAADGEQKSELDFFLFLFLLVLVEILVLTLTEIASELVYKHVHTVAEHIERAAVARENNKSYARDQNPGYKERIAQQPEYLARFDERPYAPYAYDYYRYYRADDRRYQIRQRAFHASSCSLYLSNSA